MQKLSAKLSKAARSISETGRTVVTVSFRLPNIPCSQG